MTSRCYIFTIYCLIITATIIAPIKAQNSTKLSLNSSVITFKRTENFISLIELDSVESQSDTIFGYEVSSKYSIPLRIFVFAYICLVIGYLCDDFFVPSLEMIGKQMNLSNDLIGSILIPFGTSGPEIFSAAIGVFFASNEIGTGTIIGSSVFNVLAIPAVCSLVATQIIGHSTPLEKRPILRDLLFYVIALICLTQAIRNSTIDLFDSLSLLFVFIIYITYMLYRNYFFKEEEKAKNLEKLNYEKNYGLKDCVTVKIEDSISNEAINEIKSDNFVRTNDNVSLEGGVDEDLSNTSTRCETTSILNDFIEEFLSRVEPHKNVKKDGYESLNNNEDNNGFDMTQNPILHVLLFPFVIIFNITMFNRSWAFLNFILSIIWLSILSYITVWSISGLSDQLSIPPNIAGMTILAAGSAVPDLVTGIVVIKKTKAISMSICASIASNVFAILLGLGLPWSIQIIINITKFSNPTSIPMESGSLAISCILLLITVVLFYFVLRICDWKISYTFSFLCTVLFVLFIVSNILIEFPSVQTFFNI